MTLRMYSTTYTTNYLRGLFRSHGASVIFFLRYRNENRRNRSRTGVRPSDGDRRSFTLLPSGGAVEAQEDGLRNMSRSIIAKWKGGTLMREIQLRTLVHATSHNATVGLQIRIEPQQ